MSTHTSARPFSRLGHTIVKMSFLCIMLLTCEFFSLFPGWYFRGLFTVFSLATQNQLLSWLLISVLLKISYFIGILFYSLLVFIKLLYLLYLFYATTTIHSVPLYTDLNLIFDSSSWPTHMHISPYKCLSNLCSAFLYSKRAFINTNSSHWLLLSPFTPLTSLQPVKIAKKKKKIALESKPFLQVFIILVISHYFVNYLINTLTRLKSSGEWKPSLSCSSFIILEFGNQSFYFKWINKSKHRQINLTTG